MRIAQSLIDEMVSHAREEAPNECCGMLSARDGEAVRVHRVKNADASPLRYSMDPHEQLHVEMGIDDAGLEVGAIYHSHTRSEPVPSGTDINLALWPPDMQPKWPGALHIIVGLRDDAPPDVRAWEILAGGRYEERPLEVV